MILMYHHVCPDERIPAVQSPLEGWRYCISPENFRGQLLRLRGAGWEFLSLADYVGGLTDRPMTHKRVTVTFDDGWVDNFLYALPVLQELAIPATVFVVSGDMGSVPRERRMTPNQLRELLRYDIEIGAHSRTHPNLCLLTSEQVRLELAGGRHDLESLTGRAVRFLAYPGGRFNSTVVRITRDAGFEAACSVIGSGCNSQKSRYWLYRDVFSDRMDQWRDSLRLSMIFRRICTHRAALRVESLLES